MSAVALAPPMLTQETEELELELDPEIDIHTKLVAAWLGIQGVFFFLLGAAGGISGIALVGLGPVTGEYVWSVIGLVGLGELALLWILAVPAFAAAYGLLKQRRWAWFTALALTSLQFMGIGMPIALYTFWALLRADGRKQFTA